MPSWTPAKDPDAVLDYVYTIPLDAGDSIAAKANVNFTVLSGSVVIDSWDIAAAPATNSKGVFGQDLTAWLSGGADGETSVFKVEWTTALTRQDDDVITLSVATKDLAPLALTGFVKPLPGHLIARYPAFASVPIATIQAWLTDAERFVTNVWDEGDYAAGLMSLAAHNMALAGFGADGAALVGVPTGITRMKSGSFELGFTDAAANARMTGDFTATRYGQEYQLLLRRNCGGPLVMNTGALPQYDWPLGQFGWG